MKVFRTAVIIAATSSLAITAFGQVRLRAGSEVRLEFDQALNSRYAKAGDTVRLHVADPVVVDGQVVIQRGTPVFGEIATVSKNERFGKNAHLRISLEPLNVNGKLVELEPRDKGKDYQGSRTGEAALASGGGLLVLGPLGLAGGYFVVGKPVKIKVGEHMRTEVSKSVWIR